MELQNSFVICHFRHVCYNESEQLVKTCPPSKTCPPAEFFTHVPLKILTIEITTYSINYDEISHILQRMDKLQSGEKINSEDFSTQDTYLVDAREKDEFEHGFISHSINIPRILFIF